MTIGVFICSGEPRLAFANSGGLSLAEFCGSTATAIVASLVPFTSLELCFVGGLGGLATYGTDS